MATDERTIHQHSGDEETRRLLREILTELQAPGNVEFRTIKRFMIAVVRHLLRE